MSSQFDAGAADRLRLQASLRADESIVPTGKPETSVRQVRDSRYLAVHLTPYLWAYLDMDEAVALRAQLDAEISRLSERFL